MVCYLPEIITQFSIIFGVLLLADKTSSIGVLSIVRDEVSINGVLSPGDYNQVFEVLLLGDKPHLMVIIYER